MASATNVPSFIGLALAEFGTIPQRGLTFIGLGSAVSAASELVFWSHRPKFLLLDYGIGLALLIGWSVLIYWVSMLMISHRSSLMGLCKFVATSVVMVLPIALSVGLVFVSGKAHSGAGMFGSVLLLLGSFAFLLLLPGWPTMQATAEKMIGPWNAIKATKGFRSGLIVTAFAAGSLNRAVPAVTSAENFYTACAIAVGGGVVTFLTTMIGLSIAVTAWRLMTNDRLT